MNNLNLDELCKKISNENIKLNIKINLVPFMI